MSRFHLARERARESSLDYDYTRPLIRRESKRHYRMTLSDDEDDYPYSPNTMPARPSRALTVRNTKSQLERLNIWSPKDKLPEEFTASDDEEEDRVRERRTIYKRTPHRFSQNVSILNDQDIDAEQRRFKLNIEATFSRPKARSVSPLPRPRDLNAPFLPQRPFPAGNNKWIEEDWQLHESFWSRERQRREDAWEIDEEKERALWTRHGKIRKEEDWKPLRGWRRNRIIFKDQGYGG